MATFVAKSMQIKGTYKEIWQIAFPIILGSLAHSINQLIDTAYLGNYSKYALDAITLAGIFFFNITFIAGGFARGCQVIIARHDGEKNTDKIGVAFDNLLLIALILSVLIMFVLYFFTDSIIINVIASELIQQNASIYINVLLWVVPFVILSYCFNGFFSGIGKTKITSYATIAMTITNVVLGYILIFGKLGFQKSGILGAAIATAIANVVLFLVYFSYFIHYKFHINYNALTFKFLNFTSIKNITNLSSPIVLQNLIGITSWQFFFLSVEKLGEEPLAVSGILKSIFVFLGIPVWGLASTSNTMISNVIGQNKKELVIPVLKKLLWFTLAISLSFNLVVGLFPKMVIAIFTNDVVLQQASILPFYVLLVALLFFSSGMIMNQGIIGTGATKIPAVIELICCGLYVAYCYYFILLKHCSLAMAWGCELLYWVILLICTTMYWTSGYWRRFLTELDKNK